MGGDGFAQTIYDVQLLAELEGSLRVADNYGIVAQQSQMCIWSSTIMAEPPEITRFQRRSSSTRHYSPQKWATSDSSFEHNPRENSKQSMFYILNPIMSLNLQYLIYFIQL